MRSATILPFNQPRIIGKSADYRREDFTFQREQQRGTSLDVKSPPPFKPSLVRNLIGSVVASFADYANRPFQKRRAF